MDTLDEITSRIRDEMRKKFQDQNLQIHELNMEIHRLRLDIKENHSKWQLTIQKWLLGFLTVLVYVMLIILILK